MITAIVLFVSPFVLNALTAVVIRITGIQSTTLKRVVLAVLSLAGTVGVSAATGNPIDATSVNADVTALMETFAFFLMSHGSYHLFFKAPAQPQL